MPFVLAAVAIIEYVAAPVVASIIAPVITSAAAAAGVADAAGAATAIAANALSGAGAGAVVAAATGQDVGKAALTDAITAGIAPAASSIAGGITSSVLGDTASTVIANNTTIGDVTTGAITKAAVGAGTAAATGGDVLKAAEAGAISGAAAPVIQGALDASVGSGKPTYTDPTTGQTTIAQGPPSPPSLAGSTTLGGAIIGGGLTDPKTGYTSYVGGITPLTSGFLGGVATGQTPEAAFKANLPAGIGGALSGSALYGLGVDQPTSSLIGQVGSALTQYMQQQSSSAPSQTISGAPSGGAAPSGTGQTLASLPTLTGPSPTLAQSLSIAPTLGYTPTGAVFGSSDDSGQKQNVWNVGSLRNIGSAES